MSVVAKEGQLTLYGAAGAGLRAGRYGYGDGLIDGDGGDADDGLGGGGGAEVDLPAGGMAVRIAAPEFIELVSPRVHLSSGGGGGRASRL